MSESDADMLEQIVDRVGLDGIVSLLSEICREKAEHLRSTWQDENAARSWEADARRLDAVDYTLDN